jgi:hypothetical protein
MKILIILLISTSAWAEFLPKSFSAKLVQKHMSVISEKEVRTEGRIDYRYPKDLYVKLQEVVLSLIKINLGITHHHLKKMIREL